NRAIERPNEAWASDITYVPMAHGFLYLMAIIDVASRKVLAWRLSNTGVAISMDGKGRWIDNVFIERLWRSVKNEEIYLGGYANGHEAERSLSKYFTFYNARRVHETLGYATPDEVYFSASAKTLPTAA